MDHDIIHYAKTRYSTKVFNAEKKIPAEVVEKIKELLRFSASSTNAQPWHFILASSEEAKARAAKATENYPFNTQAILDASHVVVFCSKLDIEQDFLHRILDQEEKDGRFTIDPVFKERMHEGRNMFINMHKQDYKDVQHWMDKQVYLNIGSFLLGIAALGLDAVPMEGFDSKTMDTEFELREQGYSSLVIVPIGYADRKKDFNAGLPKSRLPYSEILTEL